MRKFTKQIKEGKKKEWNGRRVIPGQKCEKKRRGLRKTKKRRTQARQEGKEWNGNEGKSVVGILSISQHFVFDPGRRGCKGFGL
jgi:hypothetical protein